MLQVALALLIASLAFAADPPRAARSVHLRYPGASGVLFYNEMTVERSTPGSYFMACGFGGGYFGIQELADGKKVAIFSVWDWHKTDIPDIVPVDERVEVVYHHPQARLKRFGGEGVGSQCMLDFEWDIGKTYCFAVFADLSRRGRTSFAARIKPSDSDEWIHVATFRAQDGGRGLRDLYSFIEDFRRDTKSAQEIRRATFGNGWVAPMGGEWSELTRAQFTASSAEWEAKVTIDAGSRCKRFYLQTGGETNMSMQLKDFIERQPSNNRPTSVPVGD